MGKGSQSKKPLRSVTITWYSDGSSGIVGSPKEAVGLYLEEEAYTLLKWAQLGRRMEKHLQWMRAQCRAQRKKGAQQ